jgi:hypothetical protein
MQPFSKSLFFGLGRTIDDAGATASPSPTGIFFTHPPLPEIWPTPELLGAVKPCSFRLHVA